MSDSQTKLPRSGPGASSFTGAGSTHTGLVRRRNEDAILTDPDGMVWAVADGMGGHGAGDVAADVVVRALSEIPSGGETGDRLVDAIRTANKEVHAEGQRRRGTTGATVVAAVTRDARVEIAWAGDCRAYLLNRGALRQLTRDHTLVQELVDAGRLAAGAAGAHPDAHVVTRAVGAAPEIDVDRTGEALAPGDLLLLCSDGLAAAVDRATVQTALARHVDDPEAACRALIDAALAAGAPDNVSVVVIRAGGGER